MATSSIGKPISFSLSQIGIKDDALIEKQGFDPAWQASVLDWLLPLHHFEGWNRLASIESGHYLFHIPSMRPVRCSKFADLVYPGCSRFAIAMFSKQKHRSGHVGGAADVREMISIAAAGVFNKKVPEDVEWIALEFSSALEKTSECKEVFDRRKVAFLFDEEELGDYPESAHSWPRVCPAKEFIDGFEERKIGGWRSLYRTKGFEDEELLAQLKRETLVRNLAYAQHRIRFALGKKEHSIEVFDELGLGKISFELPDGIALDEVEHAEELLYNIDWDHPGSYSDYIDFSPLFPDIEETRQKLCDDVDAVESIWEEFVDKANLSIGYKFHNMSEAAFLAEIGRAMGLEWQFDSYSRGVPLEDVLA